jgi:hypothetical protein
MEKVKLLKNMGFLDGLLNAYDDISADDEIPTKFVPEIALVKLEQLFSLHKQIGINQSEAKYSLDDQNFLRNLIGKYSEFLEKKSTPISSISRNTTFIKNILNINRDRNRSYKRMIFPRVDKKLENLKRVDLDYLDITKKLSNENAHSDILAALIDSERCPNISSRFLAKLLIASLYSSPNLRNKIILDSGKEVVVSEEVERIINMLNAEKLHTTCIREKIIGNNTNDGTKNNMRIDILIKSSATYIAIENKVYSHEHDNQTVHYYDWLKCNCVGDILPLGILLSPYKMWPKCHNFGILGFEDVRLSLVEALCNKRVTNDEYILGCSYLNSLENLQK